MSYGMGPRKKTAGEIAQMVGGQLQGPVADQVRRRLDAWNNPVAKLDRRHRRWCRHLGQRSRARNQREQQQKTGPDPWHH